ncbi:hypothetical protein [Janthinobacterium sp. GW458P]|uniref:hypothetical protein n=1 Tax=Janthinobacterium sp. GW458P TaxID=1981504 RepID=UPI000A3229B6|nr:hypothetical protein [Janthinobacterium sp. GW458P]MBE3028402.1 hypothetical protein [Janthinobacterium sp. GW458P]PHV13912.1 hypothetical protein CSQ90_26125 [Janthinobacterium sp. BJB303]
MHRPPLSKKFFFTLIPPNSLKKLHNLQMLRRTFILASAAYASGMDGMVRITEGIRKCSYFAK